MVFKLFTDARTKLHARRQRLYVVQIGIDLAFYYKKVARSGPDIY